MLLVVNYHYIRPKADHPGAGFFPIDIENFRRQLEALGNRFELISGETLRAAICRESRLPAQACLITFDDGLAEQHQFALPVLESLGVPAVFFLCSRPFGGRALTVHKTHWLQSNRSYDEFGSQLYDAANELGITLPIQEVDDAAAARQYMYDEPSVRRVKYLLNHVLSFDAYERIIDTMFERERNETEFCRSLYMSRPQIVDVAAKHTVGSHAHSHRPLAAMPPKGLAEELSLSKAEIERNLGRAVHLVSYPYGGATAVSMDVAAAAKRCGYMGGFTMERCINRSLQHPLLLGRLSATDAPGGARPLLEWEGEGWAVRSPLGVGRELYISDN